ncbi:MAG: ATP-dependent dethiobiotin synthetase BioD, partial [Wenzhouxiangella sp.]
IDPLALGAAICAIVADYRLVEGAGGWMVPLGQKSMTVDLARACGAEIILVVGIRLGCINHALLTARAIIADNMRLVGWIANHTQADIPDADDIIDTISSTLGAPLGTCRFQPSPADARELADSISSRCGKEKKH